MHTQEILRHAEMILTAHNIPRASLKRLENALSSTYTPNLDTISLQKYIDHTNLSFDADADAIRLLCEQAASFEFEAVCVNPIWVHTSYEHRKSLQAHFKIASVIDFPLGASTFSSRHAEAKDAVHNGADELDIVINVGLLKSGKLHDVYDLLRAAIEPGGYAKIILEMSALTDEEKYAAAILAVLAGAHMLKTSTGVNGKADVSDVRILRTIAGGTLGVKAAGGIRTQEKALEMMYAGANRIGSSASIDIISNK